jgi:hypothetical protein
VALTTPPAATTPQGTTPDGTTTDYTMTPGSASTLAGLGVSKNGPNAIRVGDEVTIKYFVARNGSPLGFIRSITLADKREIQLSTGSAND